MQKLREEAAAAVGDDKCSARLYVELHKALLHWFVPAACGDSGAADAATAAGGTDCC